MKTSRNKDGRSPALALRVVRQCGCTYQKEKPWGYTLFRWWNKKWQRVGHATQVEDAEISARKFKCVLIKCDGCGNEMHRDYPALPNNGDQPTPVEH